jgi:hypothetical protein
MDLTSARCDLEAAREELAALQAAGGEAEAAAGALMIQLTAAKDDRR